MTTLLETIKTVNGINFKNASLLTGKVSEPCKNDWYDFEYRVITDSYDFLHEDSFEDVVQALKQVSYHGVENYTGGIVASHKLLDIIKTKANANKQAQLCHLMMYLIYGIDNTKTIKWYKGLSENQKNIVTSIVNDYLVEEYNYLVEDIYNYNIKYNGE